MSAPWHPLVKRLLDGELTLDDLPDELRAEGQQALDVLGAVDRSAVTLSGALEQRVMTVVRQHASRRSLRMVRWLNRPREIRVRVRPGIALAALGVAAAVILLLGRLTNPTPGTPAVTAPDSVFVRFILYAPEARAVALAGTFNEWDPTVMPLAPGTEPGVWVGTVALPVGQYQYVFVVDGDHWVVDPAAPRVEDGFGQANSLLAILPGGRTL
jgi:hypothetical protein